MTRELLMREIAETIRMYNAKGWSPATSTNYSFKDTDQSIWVSKSGVDKSEFSASDFITVNNIGDAIGEYKDIRPSAETLIHCVIYQLFPETTVILHSHSINPTLISSLRGDKIDFEGYEIQKGFKGQTTHDATVSIPIFDNTQDMVEFASFMRNNETMLENNAFILRKHGTYAWGKNLFEAKRHLETLDYLCEAELKLESIKSASNN